MMLNKFSVLLISVALTSSWHSAIASVSKNHERDLEREEILTLLRSPGKNFETTVEILDKEEDKLESDLVKKGLSDSTSGNELRAARMCKARKLLLEALNKDRDEIVRQRTENQPFSVKAKFLMMAYDPTRNKDLAAWINTSVEEYILKYPETRAIIAAKTTDFLKEAELLDTKAQIEYDALLNNLKMMKLYYELSGLNK